MSALSKFLLAIMTVFTLGMIVHDPEKAHRPPQLRDGPQPYGVLELVEFEP
jgi:hypothetical protein